MKFKAVLLLLIVSLPSFAIPTRYIVEGNYINHEPSQHVSFPDAGEVTGWFDFDPDNSIISYSEEGNTFATGALTFNFYINGALLYSDYADYYYAQNTELTLGSIREIKGYHVQFSPWTSTPFINPEVLFFQYNQSTETISFQINPAPCCVDRYYDLSATAKITNSPTLVSEPQLPALFVLAILILLAKRIRREKTNRRRK